MLWVKTFHIFFVVCWFACIFYLPRLFVNFAIADNDATRKQLSQMQLKLLRFSIPWPILTIIFGAWLIGYNPEYYMSAAWFHAKLALVLILIIYHFICARITYQLANGGTIKTHVWYRVFNELPVFLLLGTIILVEVQPF